MSTFCRKIESTTSNSENLKKELKQRFPQVFSGSHGKCSKLKAKIKVKDSAQPVFKKKGNVSFAALEQINKELDRLNKQAFRQKQILANGQHLRPCKKEVQPNTNMRRFFHRVKRCLAGSLLSSPKPWRNFQKTKWWKNHLQIWPLWRITSNRGGWRKFQIALYQHTKRIVQIQQTDFWGQSCASNFPAGHGHHALRPWLRYSLFGWYTGDQ